MRDLTAGLQLKAAGQRGAQSNNELWKQRAMEAVKDLCKRTPLFNADDVAEVLPPLPKGASRNLISTVSSAMLSEGYCKQLAYSTPSERPERHGNKIFWYASRISGMLPCRTCGSTGLVHAVDRSEGAIYTEFCDCDLGRDSQFREIVYDHYEDAV